MKIYIRDDSKISYFKETWLKRDLGFQCLNPPDRTHAKRWRVFKNQANGHTRGTRTQFIVQIF